MAEEIALKVTIGGEERVIKSLQDLKKAKKDATDAFISGDKAAAKSIAELNEKMESVGDSVRTLKGSGIEKIEGSFAKLGEGFKTLDMDKIKVGFKGLGAAMSALPIFLIIEGIKLLVENFDEVVQWFKELIGSSNKFTCELEELKKANEDVVKSIDAQISALGGLKSNEQEIIDLTRKKIQLKIEESKVALQAAIANQKNSEVELGSAEKVFLALSGNLTAMQIKRQADIVVARNETKKATQELEAQLASLQGFDNIQTQKTLDNNAKKTADYKKNLEEQHKARVEANNAEVKATEEANLAIYNAHKVVKDAEQADADAKAKRIQDTADLEYIALQKSIDDNKKAAEQKIKDEQDVFNAKMQLANATIGIISGLEALAKKGSNAQKGLALAEIAAQTGVGFIQGLTIAQKAAAGTGPAAAFAFPIFFASQVAAVLAAAAKARAALSGGSASAPSVSSGGGFSPQGQAPAIATPSNSGSTINKETGVVNGGSNQQQKVYVLETEITEKVNKVATIKETATFG